MRENCMNKSEGIINHLTAELKGMLRNLPVNTENILNSTKSTVSQQKKSKSIPTTSI